ncbi:response regulator transcription factor [Giesbergeria anulus]|nr:response regulator transcription factor [Giesbergeria anulus]
MSTLHAHSALKTKASIGLVEDEPVLREELSFQLQHKGFKVVAFADAAGLYRHLATQPLAVVVLDIGLPGEDGISIAKLLRSHNPLMGLVFLTARSLRDDRLEGLAAGADAYLVKPVDIEELALLLQRLLERHRHSTTALVAQQLPATAAKTDEQAWQLQPHRAVLIAPNGTKVRLTLTELQCLTELISKKGKPCNHTELARAMGLMPDEWDRHRLEVIVSRLRAKVERGTGLTAPIGTMRGVGYVWDASL